MKLEDGYNYLNLIRISRDNQEISKRILRKDPYMEGILDGLEGRVDVGFLKTLQPEEIDQYVKSYQYAQSLTTNQEKNTRSGFLSPKPFIPSLELYRRNESVIDLSALGEVKRENSTPKHYYLEGLFSEIKNRK